MAKKKPSFWNSATILRSVMTILRLITDSRKMRSRFCRLRSASARK
jgi:hypothetical protein